MVKLSLFRLFTIFFKLGCTSFGGPIAHLGYFRECFVSRKKILDEAHYLQLISFCQLLPGPTSSQVSMLIGLSLHGVVGAFIAWLAFLMPSAIMLSVLGLCMPALPNMAQAGWIHGLKIVAFVVVLQACWFMAKSFCSQRASVSIMAFAGVVCVTFPDALGQIVCLLGGALAGLFLLGATESTPNKLHFVKVSDTLSGSCLAAFVLLISWALLTESGQGLRQACLGFFRAGALVFGGGHVVLPLLQKVSVPYLMSNNVFIAGYGAAQAMPGPLFSFAAYLGGVATIAGNKVLHAILFTLALYLPAFLLVFSLFPHWQKIQHNVKINKMIQGVNASVVGLLLAALYNPLFTSAIIHRNDFILALVGFVLLQFWKVPMWLLVIAGALVGQVPAMISLI